MASVIQTIGDSPESNILVSIGSPKPPIGNQVKHLLIILSLILLSSPLFSQSEETCYVVVDSSEEFNSTLLSNMSVSLISQFLKEVEPIPPGGVSGDSCWYQISVSKEQDTIFVTFKGKNLNSYGDSKLSGTDGFQQSLLKSLYRSLRDKRKLICEDYGDFLSKECSSIKKEMVVEEQIVEKPLVVEKKVEPKPAVVVVRNNDFTLKEKYESCKGNNICLRKVAKTQSINIFSLKRMARVNGWNGFVPTVGESSTLIHPKGFPKQTESTPTGTVIDSSTGLMWQKKPDGVERNWKDAKLYCQKLSLGGYSDWRLPNESVLMKMIKNKMMFASSLRNNYYWSSTVSNPTSWATYVNFGYGDKGVAWKGSGMYVRCVRGGN